VSVALQHLLRHGICMYSLQLMRLLGVRCIRHIQTTPQSPTTQCVPAECQVCSVLTPAYVSHFYSTGHLSTWLYRLHLAPKPGRQTLEHQLSELKLAGDRTWPLGNTPHTCYCCSSLYKTLNNHPRNTLPLSDLHMSLTSYRPGRST
jgi:hypothetical protein